MDDSSKPRSCNFFQWLWTVVLCLGYITAPCALPDEAVLSVWVNEAIVSTYTFSDTNMMARQKNIAKYFTAQGWINFNKALETAKLKEAVLQHHYNVTAVALLPPTIKLIDPKGEWQASMPLLVLYNNPHYQQKQTLEVVITFTSDKSLISAPSDESARRLGIMVFNSKVVTPPCQCEAHHDVNTLI